MTSRWMWGCLAGGCGGQPTDVAPQAQTGSGTAIAVDVANVYFSSSSAVMVCPKTGCAGAPTVLAASQTNTEAIAVDANNVYWVTLGAGGLTAKTGTVMKCAIGGCGGSPTTLASPQPGPWAIVFAGNNAYWTLNGTLNLVGSLAACGVGGCGNSPSYLITTTGLYPTALVTDGTTLYWADPSPNSAEHSRVRRLGLREHAQAVDGRHAVPHGRRRDQHLLDRCIVRSHEAYAEVSAHTARHPPSRRRTATPSWCRWLACWQRHAPSMAGGSKYGSSHLGPLGPPP